MKTENKIIKPIKLGNKKLGGNYPALIIAEIGQAHDGSLGIAHSYIDAVAAAGADGVKFHTHFASEESTLDDKFRIHFSKQDKTRFDYWKRMEFSQNQWQDLAEHADKKGLLFLSSAFSISSHSMSSFTSLYLAMNMELGSNTFSSL